LKQRFAIEEVNAARRSCRSEYKLGPENQVYGWRNDQRSVLGECFDSLRSLSIPWASEAFFFATSALRLASEPQATRLTAPESDAAGR
jgi:hypothetical protein